MGGLATVVSAALVILILTNVLTTYYATSLQSAEDLRIGLKELAEAKKKGIHERIQVEGLIVANSTSLRGNVSNLGQTSIAARDFNRMDIILVYTVLSNSSKVAVRLSYDSTASSSDGWRVDSVYTGGKSGETLNPIATPSASSGMWDPNEEIEIEIWLSNSNAVDDAQGIGLVVVSPSASSAISSI